VEDQAISEQSDRGMDLRRLSRVSKLESVVLKLPNFRGESAAASPVKTAGDPEVSDRSMTAVPLSCEDFDDIEWNPSTTAVPLSCEDFDEDDWNYQHA
jgi:hypothetical protein